MKTRGLYGLVLAGGRSLRMGRDKGSLVYRELSQLSQRQRCFRLLDLVCERTFLSCGAHPTAELAEELPLIADSAEGEGPGVGILSAAGLFPDVSWFVLACDFPFANDAAVCLLAKERSIAHAATLFAHENRLLEPFFTIWERPGIIELRRGFALGDCSPRRALERADKETGCHVVLSPERGILVNVNSPRDCNNNGLILDLPDPT